MLSVTQLQHLVSPDKLHALAIVGATAVVLSVYSLLLSRRSQKKHLKTFDLLPRPGSTLPFLGNTLDVAKKHKHRLYDWLTEQCELHDGPWVLAILGRSPTIVATSPEICEDVLKTQLAIFDRGVQPCYTVRDLFGRGIFAVDGDEWYFQRKSASHLFSLQMMKDAQSPSAPAAAKAAGQMKDVMHEVASEKVKSLYDILMEHALKKQELSLKGVLNQFTSDVFGKIGFGVELNCLGSGSGDAEDSLDTNEFADAFTTCVRIIQTRLHKPMWMWRLQRHFGWGEELQYQRSLKLIDDLIYSIITRSVAEKNQQRSANAGADRPKNTAERDDGSKTAKDLISLFLDSDIERPASDLKADAKLIRDMVVNFIFAGKDSTSQSMTFFIIEMNRHPEVLKKVRAEIKAQLPALMASGGSGGECETLSLDSLKDLTYLEAAIRESLRLNPIVAVTARTSNKATVLCDGTFLEKGTRVMLPFYAAARKKETWGEDAAVYNPDRWIDPATGALINVSPFKYTAFSAGPRMCLGMKFAMMEMKMTLAILLSKFALKTVEDPWSITYEVALATGVKGPVTVNVAAI